MKSNTDSINVDLAITVIYNEFGLFIIYSPYILMYVSRFDIFLNHIWKSVRCHRWLNLNLNIRSFGFSLNSRNSLLLFLQCSFFFEETFSLLVYLSPTYSLGIQTLTADDILPPSGPDLLAIITTIVELKKVYEVRQVHISPLSNSPFRYTDKLRIFFSIHFNFGLSEYWNSFSYLRPQIGNIFDVIPM